MRKFPDLPDDTSREMDDLIRMIRNGSDAERRLIGLLRRHPGVLCWLRDSHALHPDPECAEADAPLQEGLTDWLAEIEDRDARFAATSAFWSSFRDLIRRKHSEIRATDLNERRALRRGAHELANRRTRNDERGHAADSSQSTTLTDHSPYRSSQLLVRDEMKVFESLLPRPDDHKKANSDELLRQTLFRLRVWRYLAARRKNPTASRRRLLMSDAKLASLVFGFGQDQNTHETNRRTINNWMRSLMAKFRELDDRELIRRIISECRSPVSGGGDSTET